MIPTGTSLGRYEIRATRRRRDGRSLSRPRRKTESRCGDQSSTDILYNQLSPNTQWDLWVLPLFGDRQPFPFLQTKFREIGGVFSPDGKWIAYLSDESGSYQVYVQSFPPSGGQWQISSEGGSFPRFRRDGKELFYLAANGKLMAMEVKANTFGFEFSSPKPLFETHSTDRYAVTGDGQRFLISRPIEESASAPDHGHIELEGGGEAMISHGTKLGRYEIRSKIGEGGMGEVYLAK